MAGRTAELAVMGADNMTSAGSTDLMHANEVARTLIFSCGLSPVIGPVSISTTNVGMREFDSTGKLGDMTPEMASLGLREMQRVLKAAEAKAYFGLVTNWELLEAMVEHLITNVDNILTLCVLHSPPLFSLHVCGRAASRTACFVLYHAGTRTFRPLYNHWVPPTRGYKLRHESAMYWAPQLTRRAGYADHSWRQ